MGKKSNPKYEFMGNNKYLFWFINKMGEKNLYKLVSPFKIIYRINEEEHVSYS